MTIGTRLGAETTALISRIHVALAMPGTVLPRDPGRRLRLMDLLLDTHAFLWWVADAPELSRRARRTLADAETGCWLSLASCWEIAIERSLGKLSIDGGIEQFVSEQLAANGFRLLRIERSPPTA